MHPQLLSAHHSSDNAVLIDPFFSTRYLAKYASGLDENTKVKVKASKNKDELNVADESGQNTKVTGSNINQKKAEMKKPSKFCFSRKSRWDL
jgi:hypothetical protein